MSLESACWPRKTQGQAETWLLLLNADRNKRAAANGMRWSRVREQTRRRWEAISEQQLLQHGLRVLRCVAELRRQGHALMTARSVGAGASESAVRVERSKNRWWFSPQVALAGALPSNELTPKAANPITPWCCCARFSGSLSRYQYTTLLNTIHLHSLSTPPLAHSLLFLSLRPRLLYQSLVKDGGVPAAVVQASVSCCC